VFDPVPILVSARDASAQFYDTVLATLGTAKTNTDEWDDLSLAPGEPVTRRLHIGFAAPSREHADEFWRVGTAVGYRDDGAPGPRPQYLPDYYGAFLLDPDGNSVEAVHHGNLREAGKVDHVWIRVRDVATSKRFYETAGFPLDTDKPERASFSGRTGTFSLVAGEPTVNVHMAFPARENADVDEWHRTLVGAGYRDNGTPGERPIYHPGYYGAFVLDPDGNNIELVNHNRA
jgi:catechol 2,3-dioxygenase-like lactoylglutathione lyase family enzyme